MDYDSYDTDAAANKIDLQAKHTEEDAQEQGSTSSANICRICHMGDEELDDAEGVDGGDTGPVRDEDSGPNKLISPCKCAGMILSCWLLT